MINTEVTRLNNNRIELLDLTRGIALLGILLMNIRIFSEPGAAYFNPTAFGSYEGINAFWWNLQYFIADQKFMTIFSMLFGASTALICDKINAKGESANWIFIRRNLILLVIGMTHGYIIWHGDILVSYALCSIIPLIFLKAPKTLVLLLGIVILIIGSLNSYYSYDVIKDLPAAIQNQIAETYWSPTEEQLTAEIAALNGNWLEQFGWRVQQTFHFQTDTFLSWGVWRVSGLMLIGLFLYRLGFLTGTFSVRAYKMIATVSLLIGFTLVSLGFNANIEDNWSFPSAFLKNNIWNYWGSLIVGIGYISVIAIIQKSNTSTRIGQLIKGIGRTALSNYVLQSLICTSIFYGFSLFAKLDRIETALIVIMTWIVQLWLTHLWLKKYKMGPIEQLWRKLTYL